MIAAPSRRTLSFAALALSRALAPALALAGCSALQPEQAAPAMALRIDPAVARRFPGAPTIAAGIDRSGERALRDGDRLALGVEVVSGDDVERHLLEVIVHRRQLGQGDGVVTFRAVNPDSTQTLHVPERHTQRLDLELVLRTPEGLEQQRSRVSGVPEFVLDESFVPALLNDPLEHPRTHAVAVLRLVQIAQMLQNDKILQALLRKAATVPLDISLLWRRELLLTPYFDRGRAIASDPLSSGDAARYELPFDLFLNDSLLVRLMATVTEPSGAAGAIGGIVGLRAQDARHPEHQLHVHLLGAARGPASTWQGHGVLLAHGYADEGKGLAFAPNGRLLAMPGAGDDVALHDLRAADASVATRLLCKGRSTDLAFLDDRTLLVATDNHVQVFDTSDPRAVRLLATHSTPTMRVCALEVVDQDTAFVGGHGFAIARWSFVADRSTDPLREAVQATQRETMIGRSDHADGTTTPIHGTYTITPAIGWLLAVDADRVQGRSDSAEWQWQRNAGGSWTKHAIERAEAETSRRRRLPHLDAAQMFALVDKGSSVVRCDPTGTHAFGSGPVTLTSDSGTRWLSNVQQFSDYCHGFTPDGRFYAYVAPGFRALVDTHRLFAAKPTDARPGD